MNDSYKSLKVDVDILVSMLQEHSNFESAKSISMFEGKLDEKKLLYNSLQGKYQLVDLSTIDIVNELKARQKLQFDELEEKLTYMEKLCDELEEFQNELQIKTKVNNSKKK